MAKIKILCPYCFKPFNNTEAMYQCENNEQNAAGVDHCNREINYCFSEYWKTPDVATRHVFKVPRGMFSSLVGSSPKPERCDKCGMLSKRFVCPHCNNWLPTAMIERGSEIISVIGGPSSGKTNYIVTLIQQLRKYGYKINLEVTPQQVGRNKTEYTYELYKKNETLLFEDNQVIGKTPLGAKSIPWILKLENHTTKKAIYLVFYDTAGEHFDAPEQIKQNAAYLAQSSGVIVVFDTLSIKKIRTILHNKSIDIADASTPFEKTWTALSNFTTENTSLKKKPFAFVFSKFDAILDYKKDLNDCNVDEFNQNSTYIATGKVSMKKIDNISQSIKGYMEDENFCDEGQMAANIEAAWGENYRFFGVSATGCMPRLDGTVDSVKPYRVMDPLVWVLHKIGGFDIPIAKE